MEGGRHSIDVPISRTLIALRRVRSLRDPSTNSMSKFSTLVDNLNWETNSNNAITLGFDSGYPNGINDNNVQEWRSLTDSTLKKSLQVEGSDAHPINLEVVCDSKAQREKYCKDYNDKGLELACAALSLEGGDSCNETDEIPIQAEKRRRGGSRSKSKTWHRKRDGLSRVTDCDILSRVGSPCLSNSATPKGGSIISLYRNEESSLQGCGISSCWSRSLKFKESNLLSDPEEQPLLLLGQNVDWKHISDGVSPITGSPRSLCQKFMPKSFDELVGQTVVSTSLLSAISSMQINSLYLFHGPRGTGKTSAAKLFAAALNCLSPEIARPCGSCKECVLFFSGRSTDVKEVDSVRINRTDKCRALIMNAGAPPLCSRFKVYIIDECHLLHRETWAIILNGLEEISRHVIFIMVTPNLDKLPRTAVSKSQKYHFQKVKEVDIASRLEKMCVQEGIDFDRDALNFIASKSKGSLRDAEMTLDQLTLLGKKITLSLVYEVNGVVSDDELLDLLHLALSSDASNTVKRARELMCSRIDPLQLVSQLANLIMDILAGKCPDGVSEVRRKLFATDNSEADLQQLNHALKILSQTEKQLRTSKNQATWLTAALLQLSSVGSSHDVSEARLSMKTVPSQVGDFQSTSSTGDSLKYPVACACESVQSEKMGIMDGKETLESVWKRATEMCTSSSLKKFLQKRGKLVFVRLTQGIAVAELEFDHPDYVSKAEKSWKVIASALQHILTQNVELRINLANKTSNRNGKFKRPSFSLFNCSRRVHLRSQFSADCGSNASEKSDITPTFVTRDKYVETCSSDCGSQVSHTCCHGKELFKSIRNNDGNALSVVVTTPNGSLQGSMGREDIPKAYTFSEGIDKGCPTSVTFKRESKSGPREYLKFHCWKTAMFPFRKAWQLTHQQRSDHLVDYTLHYAAAN